MKAGTSRYFKRLKVVTANSVTQFLPGLFNLILSWIVIRFYHPAWWGEIVELQLVLFFSTHWAAWGNKEFLLRAFSRDPSKTSELWSASLVTRSFLLIFSLAFVCTLNFPSIVLMHLFLWILLRFIQQSFESLIIYHRQFSVSIWNELLGIAFLILAFAFFKTDITFNRLLAIISSLQFIKILLPAIIYKSEISFPLLKGAFRANLLKESAPFMFAGLAGVLQAKSDLLCIVFYLSKEQIAAYQVLMGFILFFHFIPSLFLLPFLKNMYRLDTSVLVSLQNKSIKTGLIICTLGVPLTAFCLHSFYRFHFDIFTYGLAFIYIFSTYFFFINTYILLKHERQKEVMWISFAGVVVNVICCLLFIPELYISGAMLSNCTSQLFMWMLFSARTKKILAFK